jgi:hypothetical protein
MRKWKINCPNSDAHVGYEKFLVGLELSGSRVQNLWLHCDDENCRRWFRVSIGRRGGVTVTRLPKKYHLDFTELPTLADRQE